MADQATVHIGENSPEYVALLLMREVFGAENPQSLNRKQILDTYAECLNAVRNPHVRVRMT
jgi:hypothetical protein